MYVILGVIGILRPALSVPAGGRGPGTLGAIQWAAHAERAAAVDAQVTGLWPDDEAARPPAPWGAQVTLPRVPTPYWTFASRLVAERVRATVRLRM